MTSKSMRDAQDALQPDVEAIQEFLTNCMRLGHDDGPLLVQLTAIRPDGGKAKPHSATFADAWGAAKWAAQKNVGAGVYFVHGEPAEEIDGRVRKEDMARLRHIHADLDPPAGMPQDVASLYAWRKETRAAIKTWTSTASRRISSARAAASACSRRLVNLSRSKQAKTRLISKTSLPASMP